jgi:heptaprenyl diphosphate synthase
MVCGAQGQVNVMRIFEQFRIHRQKIYENIFSARSLCIAGLLIMPALLFTSVTQVRAALFLFFWFLAWLAGKKNNPIITILIILGIVICNLFVPYGKVLFSAGAFKITEGALNAGIHRAVTLEGLIMLSRLTIRKDLRLPGAFGGLIGESFRFFSLIVNQKQRITRKNFIDDIDRLLLDLSADEIETFLPQADVPQPAQRTRLSGFIVLAIVILFSWLAWLYAAMR